MKLWTRRTTTTFQESTSILQTVDVSQVVAPQMMGASQGENRQAMGTSNEEAPPMMGNSQEVALPSMGASYRESPSAFGELGNNQKKRPRPSKHLRERKRKRKALAAHQSVTLVASNGFTYQSASDPQGTAPQMIDEFR